MRPLRRWPLHPAPREGEALSYWLDRVAGAYGMGRYDLLEYDLGVPDGKQIDILPPPGLLEALAERSGVGLGTLRCMSLAGWTPWLFDSLESTSNGFADYVMPWSVLLPPGKRKTRELPEWRAWIPTKKRSLICRECLAADGKPVRLLVWQLPLMLSCPHHHCMLEHGPDSHHGGQERSPNSTEQGLTALHVRSLDSKTWEALTTGWVTLRRCRVHAGMWFRLLRAIIDELSTAVSACGPDAQEALREIWTNTGHPLRGGLHSWRPYEALEPVVQARLLEGAAMAVFLLEEGKIDGLGEQAAVFSVARPMMVFDGRVQQDPIRTRYTMDEAFREFCRLVGELENHPDVLKAVFHLGEKSRDFIGFKNAGKVGGPIFSKTRSKISGKIGIEKGEQCEIS